MGLQSRCKAFLRIPFLRIMSLSPPLSPSTRPFLRMSISLVNHRILMTRASLKLSSMRSVNDRPWLAYGTFPPLNCWR